MKTAYGELTYCTNIHAGESWEEHFAALKKNIPVIKNKIAGNKTFGIGLRLSNMASIQLLEGNALSDFQAWLKAEGGYVFTMNGFPYGGFHNTIVKDLVHAPDWTTDDRTLYTTRLFDILNVLLPEQMEGGISTSPLSYKYWHTPMEYQEVFEKATLNILKIVAHLFKLKETSGKHFHLDIEPEPDGLIESGPEFIKWYEDYLLPLGIPFLAKQINVDREGAIQIIKQHVQICYDVCHFAVGYEDHQSIIDQLHRKEIKIGKIQISAALKAAIPDDQIKRTRIVDAFRQFNESTYLHQVVALHNNGKLKRYPDLPEALTRADDPDTQEWRSHFHVPLFINKYGALESTQDDIKKVLSIHKKQTLTQHLEVETYTWEVLPEKLKVPISESIIREMEWVKDFLDKD